MPRQCCFLCASDEGVFLDITADNKQVFSEKFEICSLVKVPTEDQLPTKLCHKCAYELNQCSSFVQKFKRTMSQRTQTRRANCSLCNQPAKDEFIFDLSKDQDTRHNSLDRIQKVFNYDVKVLKANQKFVCLPCRYMLDLLIDLKNVSAETAIKLKDLISEKIDYESFPKVHTVVVNRKTTITESARTTLPTLEKSNNNSIVTRTRIRNNVSGKERSKVERSKPRVCGKCRCSVKIGDEMFKTHKTRSTVCKKCWINMDVDKEEAENQAQQAIAETKVCKVFLKDVLKDGQSSKGQIATNKNVENECKADDKVHDTRNGVTKQSQKRSATEMKDEGKNACNEQTTTKKSKIAAKRSDDESGESEPATRETKAKKRQETNAYIASQSADSDSSTLKRRTVKGLTAQKQATGSSLSDADIESKRNRKKLRNILEGITVIKDMDSTDESSSNANVTPARKRTRFSSSSPVLVPKKNKPVPKTTASPPQTPRTVSTRQSKFPKRKASQESQTLESDDEVAIFDTTTYICDECGATYENRLMGLTHKLTHYKQPKVQLQKLKSEDVTTKETPGTTEATDEQSKDLSEAIAIRVDDDEEEVAKDTGMTESNAEDKTNCSKKETMEDAVDMELVMKESDDDCSHEKKSEESEKKEETEKDLEKDKVDDKDNRYDNDGTYESVEKDSINTEEKENTPLVNVEDTDEERENVSSGDVEDTQEEKENTSPGNVDDVHEKRQEKEEESDGKAADDDENKDTDGKVARTERKDSSEEEVISLGVWEAEPEATVESRTDSTDKVNDDKTDSSTAVGQEQSVVEKEAEVEVNDPSSPDCTEKPEFNNTDQSVEANKSPSKPVIVEDVILLDEHDATTKDTEDEGVSISELNVTKQESQNDCVDTAVEVLQEVVDLASVDVQTHRKSNDLDNEDDCAETETLENISREIQNSGEVVACENGN